MVAAVARAQAKPGGRMSTPELCGGTMHKGQWFQGGRVVLTRDPNRQEEACPGGLTVCEDCSEEFGQFLKAAYDAQARRAEHRAD
jgi:hypothetical protein